MGFTSTRTVCEYFLILCIYHIELRHYCVQCACVYMYIYMYVYTVHVKQAKFLCSLNPIKAHVCLIKVIIMDKLVDDTYVLVYTV